MTEGKSKSLGKQSSDRYDPLKFVQPELGFRLERLKIDKGSTVEEAEVSQLVRKGALLASFPNYMTMRKQGYLRAPIEAGRHVVYDEQAHLLLAAISGYPKTHVVEREDMEDLLIIEILPCVKVSHNKMQASMIFQPTLPQTNPPGVEDIAELIREAGITYGINDEALAKIEKTWSEPIDDFEEILFAEGTFPGEGEDARIQFELEIGPLAGRLLDDDTIDFRDRKVMVRVEENQHVATKIPAVPGTSGFNVFGTEFPSKEGKDISINIIGDARFDEEKNRVYATRDGAMSVVNDDTIKIAAKTTIHTDVDYETGNIDSANNVIIKGSITPGFVVDVEGDLEIGGGVSSAKISCGGNVVIKGGIAGQSSSIDVGGDVDLKFIERGTVKAGGLVVIRKQCYYSSIEAKANIRCHAESTILGGILLAGNTLSLGNVGAESCDPAILGAGIEAERYHLLNQLRKELVAQQDEIIQAIQLHGKGSRPKKIRRMEEAAIATKRKMLTLNLIPGTELYSRLGQGSKREQLEEEDPLYLLETRIEDVRIEIRGKVFAGTTIMLGNRKMVMKQDVTRRKFRLSKNLKSIMALPL